MLTALRSRASLIAGTAVLSASLPIAVATPAKAHSGAELEAWLTGWDEAVTDAESGHRTEALRLELAGMQERHPWYWAAPAAAVQLSSDPIPTNSPEYWRGLVSAYFAEADMDWAMRIMACESGGNPDATNPSSGAAGLFQHLPKYWAERSANAGIAGTSPYDPPSNIAVAAWLFYEGGGASHWVCK